MPELDKKFKHNIDVVVDRIKIKNDIKKQLKDEDYEDATGEVIEPQIDIPDSEEVFLDIFG